MSESPRGLYSVSFATEKIPLGENLYLIVKKSVDLNLREIVSPRWIIEERITDGGKRECVYLFIEESEEDILHFADTLRYFAEVRGEFVDGESFGIYSESNVRDYARRGYPLAYAPLLCEFVIKKGRPVLIFDQGGFLDPREVAIEDVDALSKTLSDRLTEIRANNLSQLNKG
jgi:hypothetical protein